jgi:large subunit ribosomal protein L1
VREVKAGKIDFKVDKTGIIHASIGKVSFSPQMLAENAQELINTISKLKPSSAKGTYFRSVALSSTMSPGLSIDKSTVAGI